MQKLFDEKYREIAQQRDFLESEIHKKIEEI